MGLLSWSLTVATPLECALTGNGTAAKGGELLGHLLKSPSGGLSLSLRLPVLLGQWGRSRELRFLNKILLVSPIKSQIGLINKLS